jgi:hypothetical protein
MMPTPPYQVYVDGPRDGSSAAVKKLAAAIGQRYGLAAADLEARLARGRFRVKANADRVTAEQYVRELEGLGARCSVIDAKGAPVDLAALPPMSTRAQPAARPATALSPRPASSLPPPSAPRPASAPLPPASPRPATAPVATGLAAASKSAGADLGALGRDGGAIALASLDGEDEPIIEPTSLASASFAPPPAAAPPPSARPATPPPVARPATPPPVASARPATPPREIEAPAGMFDAPEDDAEMELALDVVEEKQKKAAAAPALPAGRDSRPALAFPGAADAPAVARPARPPGPPLGDRVRGWLADAKVRFAAGVFAAVLIGFLPAVVVGSIRMSSALAEIDQKLDEQQNAITTVGEYETLDRTRALALERKYAERRDIAITAFLIWAVAGAAVAFVWFRRVPWDRIARAPAPG